eukprot:m.188251 g.188251  ORF g.188251 m.188251 type:complete len:84 (+) comp39375_c0_seq7:33-284(+)
MCSLIRDSLTTASKTFACGLIARSLLTLLKRRSLSLAPFIDGDNARTATFLAAFTGSYKLIRQLMIQMGVQVLCNTRESTCVN